MFSSSIVKSNLLSAFNDASIVSMHMHDAIVFKLHGFTVLSKEPSSSCKRSLTIDHLWTGRVLFLHKFPRSITNGAPVLLQMTDEQVFRLDVQL